SGEQIIDAVVKPHGVLRGVAAATAAAGLVFGVGGFAKNNLVAVSRVVGDDGPAGEPSGDGLGLVFFVFIAFARRLHHDGLHVSPFAAGFDDNQFVPAIHLAEFGGVDTGSNAKGGFVDKRAADGVG